MYAVYCLITLMFVATLSWPSGLSTSEDEDLTCLKRVIESAFGKTKSIYLIFKDHLSENVFRHIENPRYVINNRSSTTVKNRLNEHSYVFFLEDGMDMEDMIEIPIATYIGYGHIQRNVRYVVLATPRYVLKNIFHLTWRKLGLFNVLVIQNNSVYTYDPFKPENKCGDLLAVFEVGHCNILQPKFVGFPKQMNRCPFDFIAHPNSMFFYKYPVSYALRILIKEFTENMNATGNLIPSKNVHADLRKRCNRIKITGVWSTDNGCDFCSIIVYHDYFTYVVPKAQQIPFTKIIFLTFQSALWVSILVVFVITIVAWWAITAHTDGRKLTGHNLSRAFVEIAALTFCGCTSNPPINRKLRGIFLCYLVYVVHMHCAFNSNLSNVLTVPQYERGINSVQDIIDRKIQILSDEDTLKNGLKSMHKEVKELVMSVPPDEIKWLFLSLKPTSNCTLMLTKQDLYIYKSYGYGHFVELSNLTTVGSLKLFFWTNRKHDVMNALNTHIASYIESGLFQTSLKKNEYYWKKQATKKLINTSNIIEMKHVNFVFLFLIMGLLSASIIFCAELIVHFYTKN